ncbi:MAG: hypothetical protein ACI4F9_08625 [Lachnospiraceae bacterium]
MNIKKFIKKHQKKLVILLIIFILSRILIGTHYISKRDSSGAWKMVCHQGLTDNPEHIWELDIYYYGLHAPEKIYVKTSIDGWTDDEYMDVGNYGFWDSTDGDEINVERIFLNIIAPSFPSFAGYSLLTDLDKPKSIKLEIKWKEGNDTKYTVIERK